MNAGGSPKCRAHPSPDLDGKRTALADATLIGIKRIFCYSFRFSRVGLADPPMKRVFKDATGAAPATRA